MTEEELRAIEMRAKNAALGIAPACAAIRLTEQDVPALCAEVRRLRDLLRETDERKAELGHQNERLREEADKQEAPAR